MGRVALVTGGSRGIGAAISKALKDAGCTVAANYAGNDEAAAGFKEETGINVYKWSVADDDEEVELFADVTVEADLVAGIRIDAAVARGRAIFASAEAACATCHPPPTFATPGWLRSRRSSSSAGSAARTPRRPRGRPTSTRRPTTS